MLKIVVLKSVLTENRHYQIEEVKLPHSPKSLNSITSQVPGGVYTTFRTYDRNKILPFEYQIHRLEESSRLVGQEIHLDKRMIQDFLRQALERSIQTDARLRLSVDLEQEPGTLYLGIEPLQMLPEAVYANGVWVITRPLRRLNPKAKQTSFIFVQEKTLKSLPAGAHEALLVDEKGNILEGLSSNFFAVENSVIRTAGSEVLPGITRSLVLQAATSEDFPIVENSVSVNEIPNLQEAFLTSSSRSVLPIRKIDHTVIGTGKPGLVTQQLARAYRREVRSQLVEL